MKAIVVCGLLVLVALAAGCRRSREASTSEVAAYSPKISFSASQVSQSDTMAGPTVYYVDGRVTNGGDGTIALLEVDAQFVDVDRKPLYHERAFVVNERKPPLKAGETRDFRLGFEGIPPGWNQAAPALTITRVVFE